jgi:thiol-disulfide isomerase/thioredoxin
MKPFRCLVIILGLILMISACIPAQPASTPEPTSLVATITATPGLPEWFNIKMTDVRSGKTFTIHDFAGKVVLIQTMAQWCPTCQEQQDRVKEMHNLLNNTKDLISVSLDTDINEDEASLKAYAAKLGYDWYFAVAPRDIARALGNLYSAEYLNPPLSPMLIIDRQGSVYGLPFGLKPANSLKNTLQQYLTP